MHIGIYNTYKIFAPKVATLSAFTVLEVQGHTGGSTSAGVCRPGAANFHLSIAERLLEALWRQVKWPERTVSADVGSH